MGNEVQEQRSAKRFIELDKIIRSGASKFNEYIDALVEVHGNRMYMASHKTFAAYCDDCGISLRTAYRMISDSKGAERSEQTSVQNVANGTNLPQTTTQIYKSSVNGVHVPDPPEIAEARRKGKMPIDAFIEIDQPDQPTTTEEIAEEHEQAKAQTEDELNDEDWLETLPLSKKLTVEYCLKIFRKDALAWRSLSKPRENYLYHAKRTVKRGDRGEFCGRVISFLSMDGPDKWNLCNKNHTGGCGGIGRVGKNNLECPNCRGRGYTIR